MDIVFSEKKCSKRGCKNLTTYKYCIPCATEMSKKFVAKKYKDEELGRKKKLKELKFNPKSALQDKVNEIARLIDYGNVCISCQNVCKRENGCHFHSVGSNEKLRYNLLNIWLGCYSCNGEKGGNIQGYDLGLVDLVGKDYWDYLKFQFVLDNKGIEIKAIDFKGKISIANQIIKELKSDLFKRGGRERVEMRKILNERIGIYK